MNRYEFQLDISSVQYLDYYRGTVKQVVVRCATGQVVQFPAGLLQKFITTDGIHGRFALTCDAQNKGAELQRLGP